MCLLCRPIGAIDHLSPSIISSKLASACKEEEALEYSATTGRPRHDVDEEEDETLKKMSVRDVLGDFKTDVIIEQFQELLESMKKLGFNQPRPWREFMACFKPPKKWRKAEVEERISANFFFYRSNYAILMAVMLSFSIFTSYTTVAVVCLSIGSYALLLGWTGQLELFGRVLDRRDRVTIASVFSLFILLISGALLRMIWTLSASMLLITAHILFRPRTLSSKANLAKEEMKLNGYINISSNHKNHKQEYEDVETPINEEGFGSYQIEGSRTVRSRS